ncbi:hypothetical protein TURU_095586 [Turdus rufiventris]|nr:hypothetical protein TURU_095586 [Turdus rufiventris]
MIPPAESHIQQGSEIPAPCKSRGPDALRLHNVLWTTETDSRVILSWNNNLTKEETKKYDVKYILVYKFFNTTKEMKERLQEKEKIIRLKLHSGFNAKVKTQLFAKGTEDIIKESDWTELTYKAPPEKLNPPINVSVSLENRSLEIHWKPPPTIGSAKKKCFLYQVKITDHKIVNVTAENYKYPFHKPAKKCAAQVRVKKEICIANKIWSDWSEPVLIHDGLCQARLKSHSCEVVRRQEQETCGVWRWEVAAVGTQELEQQQKDQQHMDRGFDIQRHQGYVEISSGRMGHAQDMTAEFQEKEGME